MDRIDELAAKLCELAKADVDLEIFGVSTFGSGHGYRLNPPAAAAELAAFEREYAVLLPDDYRAFLLRIGNGGAGPYYGLLSLDDAVSMRPDHKSRHFLSTPFPLTEYFNPYEKEADETNAAEPYDDILDEDRCIRGSIALAHQGCGYYDRLVITGPQRGTVWTDGRVSDQGIAPLSCDFYTWYLRWLLDSFAELKSGRRRSH